MSLLAVLGLVLIVLALVHVIPLVLGLVLGAVLLLVGGGSYYNGRRGGTAW
jgi:hypothetical protein